MTLDRDPNHRPLKKSRGLDPIDFGALVRRAERNPIHNRSSQPMDTLRQAQGLVPSFEELDEAAGGCPLASFANPCRLGVIPGIDFKEGALSLTPSKWGCCQASGERTDTMRQITYRCDLHFRFQETQALFELIRRQDPDANMMEVFAPIRFTAILEQLARIASKDLEQGRVFTRESQKHPFPVLFWATAFAALWRFGLKIKVRHFGHPQEYILGQKRTELRGKNTDKDDYDVMMVSHVTDLWSSRSFENLDYLVTSAYNARKPLFLDLAVDAATMETHSPKTPNPPPQDLRPRGIRSTKSGFKSLMIQARQKTTAKVYSPGFLRKMRAVCLGIPRGVFEAAPP